MNIYIKGSGDAMKDREYVENLILSMYKYPTNTGQIHNVLTGRSTPSILYLVEMRSWQHLYGSLPRVSRSYIEQLHKQYLNHNLIYKQDNKYLLNDTASKELENYFNNHLELCFSKDYLNADGRNEFWGLIRFITQVISEKQYNNNKYIPLKDDLTSQLFIKNLLHNDLKFDECWIEEQRLILKSIDQVLAELLANSLSGHDLNGLTLDQISRYKNISKSEVYFMKLEAIKIYMQTISDNSLLMHQKVMDYVLSRMNFGLTSSASETYQLIREGKTVQDISALKSVKVSTVKEHILEIAFKLNHEVLASLIPTEIKEELVHYFDTHQSWQFKEAAQNIKELEFYHYRLIELELIRNGR